MTVGSALITNYLLENNNLKVSKINNRLLTIDQQIDSYWQYVKDLDAKSDLAVIVLSEGKDNNALILELEFNNYFKINIDTL